MAMGSQGLGSNFIWSWHDPLGRCVKRWLGNVNQVPTGPITYFYYDGWNLVQEGPNASTADRLYVHGGRVDEIVASQVGGHWYNHHYDARGHCILLTTASNGTIREQYDYDAFGYPYFYDASGNKLVSSFQSGNRFLFTGREWIKDLRVYDYRNRVYQPELGRFLQPDPKQFEAGDYNLYRYCHNDPVNLNDPMGLADETWERQMLWQRGGDGTVTEQLLVKRATAALDEWAGWAKRNQKEVAGTINKRGQVLVGPEKDREGLVSNPGITDDSVATWHIHVPGVPGSVRGAEYQFSENRHRFGGPSDASFLRNHPYMMHFVGVLDGDPGKFTIFAYMKPEQAFQWLRPNFGVTPGFGRR